MKNRIKPYRAFKDLTQAQLAEKTGVSRQTINAIEKGKYNPSVVLAIRISRILDKKVEEVFVLEKGE